MNKSKRLNEHVKKVKESCVKEEINNLQDELKNNGGTSIKEEIDNVSNGIDNSVVGTIKEGRKEYSNSANKNMPYKETLEHEQEITKVKTYDEQIDQSAEDTTITNRLRPRNKFKKPIIQLNLSDYLSDSEEEKALAPKKARKMVLNNRSQNNDCEGSLKSESIAPIILDKVNYDIKIDPNVVDRYTNKPVTLLPGAVMPSTDSPETKENRIKEENLVVARQCRLHPANEKFNQGPVVNPPLISPGKIVGYTPAGQRYEVDLNFQRPRWFNSEYARMQFDDATKINVKRMFHELENGRFLPDCLDADLERKYFAEQALITNDATKYFDECSNVPSNFISSLSTSDDKEHLSLLDSEQQLAELNMFAATRYSDFPVELAKKLNNALTLQLTPLMFMKNPIIVDTIEMLTLHCSCYEVVRPALALLNKIKSLFDVPKSLTFKKYLESEVLRLKEITKDMSVFEVIMMTEEPTGKTLLRQAETEEPTETPKVEVWNAEIQCLAPTSSISLSLPHEIIGEWVEVQDGDMWVDINTITESFDGNQNSGDHREDDDTDDDDDTDESSSSLGTSSSDEEDVTSDQLRDLSNEDLFDTPTNVQMSANEE